MRHPFRLSVFPILFISAARLALGCSSDATVSPDANDSGSAPPLDSGRATTDGDAPGSTEAGNDDNEAGLDAGPSLSLAKPITVPGVPQGGALDPTNHRLYVTTEALNGTGTQSTATLTVIDTTTDTVVTSVPLDQGVQAEGVAVSAASKHVYVATNKGVLVFDEATNARTATAPIQSATPGSTPAALVADGTHVYALDTLIGADAELLVIDTTSDSLTKTVTVSDANFFSASAGGVAIDPTSHDILVLTTSRATPADGLLTILDRTTQVPVGAATHYPNEFPVGITSDPSNGNVYIATRTSVAGAITGKVHAIDPYDIQLPAGYAPTMVIPIPKGVIIVAIKTCGEGLVDFNYIESRGTLAGPFDYTEAKASSWQAQAAGLNVDSNSAYIYYSVRGDCSGTAPPTPEVEHFTW